MTSQFQIPDLPTNASTQIQVVEAKPAVSIDKPKFSARALIEPDRLLKLEQYAANLLKDKDFGPLFFIQLIEKFGISQVPGLDAMLDTMKLKDAGVIGERLQKSTMRMRKVGDDLPEFDTRFIERFNQGKAKVKEVVKWVRYVSIQVKKAIQQYQTVLTLLNEDIEELERQYNLMIESVIRDDQLAKEQDARTDKLLSLLAVMEYLQEKINGRLIELEALLATPNKQLEDEKENLEGVVPLAVKRIGTLPPMIHMGSMNEKRFLGQRNANAVVALTLGDFIEIGVSQWKTDIVMQLDALQMQASAFAVQTGIDFMNEEAIASSDAYAEQVALANNILKDMFIKVETMNHVRQVVIETSEKTSQALKEAAMIGDQASREVEAGRNELNEAETRSSKELRDLLERK